MKASEQPQTDTRGLRPKIQSMGDFNQVKMKWMRLPACLHRSPWRGHTHTHTHARTPPDSITISMSVCDLLAAWLMSVRGLLPDSSRVKVRYRYAASPEVGTMMSVRGSDTIMRRAQRASACLQEAGQRRMH